MNDLLSTKEIAEQLGVSKQRVYRCIKANHINEAVCEVVKGNKVYKYDFAAVTRISDLLRIDHSDSHEAHQKQSSETVEVHHEALYEALLKQLEVKDQQLADQRKQFEQQLQNKDQQIDKLQQLLDQEQQLHAMSQKRVLELEDKMAAAEPTVVTEDRAAEPEMGSEELKQPEQKKWWEFWKK